MDTEFNAWLIRQVDQRGWNNSELARRAGVVPSTVSMVLSHQKRPGLDFCVGISRAFKVSPESVLRKAGLLPSLPPEVAEEREVVGILRDLPSATRSVVVIQLRALAGTSAPLYALNEPASDYNADDLVDDEMERDLLTEFRRLPAELQEEAIREVERLGELRIRIIGAEEAREESPRGERNQAEV